jgi:2-C-methyl-D-erythritol 4-phosphate cytidylyltransferase
MGSAKPKQFLHLAGKPILAHTLSAISRLSVIAEIFLMVPREHIRAAGEIVAEWARGMASSVPQIRIVPGGSDRRGSVYKGLMELPADCGWVMVHDGVRPFASAGLIRAVWKGARATGACIAAVPSTDTVKRACGGVVRETLSRDEIWLVQTPQVFRKRIIVDAYEKAVEAGWDGTDDASFVERNGGLVSVVKGERTNIKVTTREDLEWAEWFLSRRTEKGDLL